MGYNPTEDMITNQSETQGHNWVYTKKVTFCHEKRGFPEIFFAFFFYLTTMAENNQTVATLIDEAAEQRKNQFLEFLSHEVKDNCFF